MLVKQLSIGLYCVRISCSKCFETRITSYVTLFDTAITIDTSDQSDSYHFEISVSQLISDPKEYFGYFKFCSNESIEPFDVWVHLYMSKTEWVLVPLHYDNESKNWDSNEFGVRLPKFDPEFPLTVKLWIEFKPDFGPTKNALFQISKMFVEQTHCDVKFSFKNGESIGSHVSILSSRSPVFAAMFKHEMKESISRQVDIEDIQPDIFKQLLYYMYAGKLEKRIEEESVRFLYEAADKYDIEDLRKECVTFILASIYSNNVLDLVTWAHLHSVEDVKEVALEYLSFNGKEICMFEEWESFVRDNLAICVIATRRMMEK